MLKDKIVVVVGGATGIGFAVASAALRAGAEVCIGSRSQAKLDAALARLGQGARALTVDAASDSSVAEFFRAIGPFDHLAMCIKTELAHSPFLKSDQGVVQAAFDVKFWGQYRLARHAAASIRPGGSLVLTSGAAAQRAVPGMSAQSAMNGAIEALARAIACELRPLRVNTVSPGVVAAERPDPARSEWLDKAASQLPLGRVGGRDEIAQAYLYLFANTYATGSVTVVDGGFLC